MKILYACLFLLSGLVFSAEKPKDLLLGEQSLSECACGNCVLKKCLGTKKYEQRTVPAKDLKLNPKQKQ